MAINFPFQFDQRYQPGQIPQFGSFGPTNISNMLQSSISKLADPMVARLRELEVVNKAAALNRDTSNIFNTPSTPAPPGATTSAPGTVSAPSGATIPATGITGFSIKGDRQQYADYITDAATKRGIDPQVALRVVHGESGFNPAASLITPKEASFGLWQLNAKGGLGQTALQQGIKLSSDNWKEQTDFALDQVLKNGWTPWSAAKNAGIGKWEGIGNAPTQTAAPVAAPTPVPQQAPTASFAPPVAPAPTPAAAAAVGPPGGAPVYSGGNLNMPREAPSPIALQQVASLDPTAGTGSIRNPAPEIAPRRVPTQAFGPDGQPLPPAQQPAQPLPSGGPPNEQPDPPPPPPVQPPPPPVPPVQPPPPVQQAALPTPPVPASQQVAPPSVAPAAAVVPPQQMAAGVPQVGPSTRAPIRVMPQPPPQQQAPQQQRAAPVDQTADRFWEAVGRNAQTPEQALAANLKRLELRQPKTTYTVVDGVLVAHDERGNVVPVYGEKNKGAPTVEVGENKGRMQWNPKTGRYDIPVADLGDQGNMFKGNSVEGQSLNHLVRQNILTRDQAATVGAGKTVTQPNGEQYFIPPLDLVGGASVGVVRRSPDGTITPVLPQAAPTTPGGGAPAASGPPPTPGAVRLTPAKEEKPDKVAADSAARIGVGNEFLADVPSIRKQIIDGALDTPKARVQLRYGYGEAGQMGRRNASGVDALVRGLTGMGMPQAEAEDYANRYKFTYKDTKENYLWKLENLERELRATREAVLSGHRITDPALRGRDTPDPNRKGFKTPSGTDFYEVR